MAEENKPLLSEKEFLRGMRYLLKHERSSLFYSNLYLPALLKEFCCKPATKIQLFLKEEEIQKFESVLKQMHFAFGKQQVFMNAPKTFSNKTLQIIEDVLPHQIVYISEKKSPISFIVIDEKHYFLKHQEKEGFLAALNADKDIEIKDYLKTAIQAMKEIEKEAVLYQGKPMLLEKKNPVFPLTNKERTKE